MLDKKYAILEKRMYAISIGKEKRGWIPSKTIKIRFDRGRLPEDLGYTQEETNQDQNR